jgi:hypothetical protein
MSTILIMVPRAQAAKTTYRQHLHGSAGNILSEPWHWGDVDNLENRLAAMAAIMTYTQKCNKRLGLKRCERTLAEVEATGS